MINHCSECRKRPARFVVRGKTQPQSDKRHDLCRQCYRAYRDKLRMEDAATAPSEVDE